MSGRLIALYKQPGISPVGVGETWRRLMVKCLLKFAGPEAKPACGTTKLARGLEAGIEGAIHAMRVLFEEHRKEEDWGFLLIDARNAFNEENPQSSSFQCSSKRTRIAWMEPSIPASRPPAI